MRWHRRLSSDLALWVPALAAWLVVLWDGLIVRPLSIIDSDLVVAYEKIAPSWGQGAVLAVCVVLGLVSGSYAGWRAGAAATWRLDRPFSLWRTATWTLLLFGISGLLAGVSPSLLSIRFGKMIPGFYDSIEFAQPHVGPRTILFLISLGAGAALLLTNQLIVRVVTQRPRGTASEKDRGEDYDGGSPRRAGR